MMDPNVVSLSPMRANLTLEKSVPVNPVPENPVPVVPVPVPVALDENSDPPEILRSTVVRWFEDPVCLLMSFERPAVRSSPFRVTR